MSSRGISINKVVGSWDGSHRHQGDKVRLLCKSTITFIHALLWCVYIYVQVYLFMHTHMNTYNEEYKSHLCILILRSVLVFWDSLSFSLDLLIWSKAAGENIIGILPSTGITAHQKACPLYIVSGDKTPLLTLHSKCFTDCAATLHPWAAQSHYLCVYLASAKGVCSAALKWKGSFCSLLFSSFATSLPSPSAGLQTSEFGQSSQHL